MFTPSPKKTCLIFTEGHSDLEFFDALISLTAPSFLNSWSLNFIHGRGGSPKVILQDCENERKEGEYEKTICIIDIDKVIEEARDRKKKKGHSWEKDKQKLESQYPHINIFWLYTNLEEEQLKTIKIKASKQENKEYINNKALKKIDHFRDAEITKRFFSCF